jgi:hypothetical protein
VEEERNEMLETQPGGRWADTEPGDQRGRTWLAWALAGPKRKFYIYDDYNYIIHIHFYCFTLLKV